MSKGKIFREFIKWTRLKVRIHLLTRTKGFYFKEREIWWASLGLNIGYEEDGKGRLFERPILILRVFNAEVLWIVPLTSKEKIGKYYHQFEYEQKKYTAILSQLKLISSKRLLRKIRTFPKEGYDDLKNQLKNLL